MIQFDTTNFGSLDLASMGQVITSFIQLPSEYRETFGEGACGYNTGSGYVYIGLECGVCLASNFGTATEYIATNHDTGEEVFCGNFETALRFQEQMNA